MLTALVVLCNCGTVMQLMYMVDAHICQCHVTRLPLLLLWLTYEYKRLLYRLAKSMMQEQSRSLVGQQSGTG